MLKKLLHRFGLDKLSPKKQNYNDISITLSGSTKFCDPDIIRQDITSLELMFMNMDIRISRLEDLHSARNNNFIR